MTPPYIHEEDASICAQRSLLWDSLEEQNGKVLPYLLERYLLLRNWNITSRELDDIRYELNYLHLLVADLASVAVHQEERIRDLEARVFGNYL
jgi:hypothetical protein